MANLTNISQAIEPLTQVVGGAMNLIEVLLGGVVGIYILMLVLRIYELRYLKNKFDKLEADIQSLKRKKKQ